jgi:hypothetical protein
MHPTAAQAFVRDLEGKLADSVRPAAEALIEVALTAIDIRREPLSEGQAPRLLEVP